MDLQVTRIAFIAQDLFAPSHAWMRSTIDLLDHRVVWLADLNQTQDLLQYGPHDVVGLKKKHPVLERLRNQLLRPLEGSDVCLENFLEESIREISPDVIMIQYATNAVRLRRLLKVIGIPVHVHCHGYDVCWDLRNSISGKRVHRQCYIGRVRTLPANVSFLANSDYIRRKLTNIGVENSRIRIRRFGFDVQELDVSSENDERTVLFLGRVEDVKGPIETLKAFIDVSRAVPGAKLVVAGAGTLLPQMRVLASNSKFADRITFLGAVNEKLASELLKRAAILTAHSQKSSATMQEETCGVAFLQAMAMGVPVVTGRSGGIPEYIVDGVNGFLFEPGDIAKHSYLLKSLLMSESLRASIGKNAKATIQQQFTREGELRSLVYQSGEV